MINREQIKKMLDCYGADLERWPCTEKRALAKFIENDTKLSEEQADIRLFDQTVRESLESFEPEWSVRAENRLSEKIINLVSKPEDSQPEMSWWHGWFKLVQDYEALRAIPVLPVGIAVLAFVVAIQMGLQNEQPLDNNLYSTAELDAWLIFEGIADDPELSVEPDLYELAVFENEEVEDSLEPEIAFFL